MLSKIDRLEKLLNMLSSSMTESKRYTANQVFKAENINISDGSTMNIQMNNTILSVEIVSECLEIINEIKPCFPTTKEANINTALNHYKNVLLTKALEASDYREKDAAKKLGMTHRQIRYCIQKNPQLLGGNVK